MTCSVGTDTLLFPTAKATSAAKCDTIQTSQLQYTVPFLGRRPNTHRGITHPGYYPERTPRKGHPPITIQWGRPANARSPAPVLHPGARYCAIRCDTGAGLCGIPTETSQTALRKIRTLRAGVSLEALGKARAEMYGKSYVRNCYGIPTESLRNPPIGRFPWLPRRRAPRPARTFARGPRGRELYCIALLIVKGRYNTVTVPTLPFERGANRAAPHPQYNVPGGRRQRFC